MLGPRGLVVVSMLERCVGGDWEGFTVCRRLWRPCFLGKISMGQGAAERPSQVLLAELGLPETRAVPLLTHPAGCSPYAPSCSCCPDCICSVSSSAEPQAA